MDLARTDMSRTDMARMDMAQTDSARTDMARRYMGNINMDIINMARWQLKLKHNKCRKRNEIWIIQLMCHKKAKKSTILTLQT